MDGIPAPISRIASIEDAGVAKRIVTETLYYDLTSNDVEGSACSKNWVEDLTW